MQDKIEKSIDLDAPIARVWRALTDHLETLVEFKLESTASGTHLVVVESGFSAIPESSRSRIFQRNDAGWAEQMKNIKRHVNG